jgi:hypothetical protein
VHLDVPAAEDGGIAVVDVVLVPVVVLPPDPDAEGVVIAWVIVGGPIMKV